MSIKTFVKSALAAGSASLGLWLVATDARADQDCRLLQAASLPVTLTRSGVPIIPVKNGEHMLRMLFDTGARASFIEGRLVFAPDFVPDTTTQRRMIGGGGPHIFNKIFMQLALDHKSLGPRLVLASNPTELMYGNEFDGILGGDITDDFDEEFDPTAMRINFFMRKHCPGQVVYWANEYSTIPYKISAERQWIEFPIKVNGTALRGMLDTGDSHTSMRWQTASDRFGLTTTSPGVYGLPTTTLTSDGSKLPTAQYSFDTIELGDLKIHHATVNLLPQYSQDILSDLFGTEDWGPQIILGMDVLRQLRFYISRNDRAIYFTVPPPPAPAPGKPS